MGDGSSHPESAHVQDQKQSCGNKQLTTDVVTYVYIERGRERERETKIKMQRETQGDRPGAVVLARRQCGQKRERCSYSREDVRPTPEGDPLVTEEGVLIPETSLPIAGKVGCLMPEEEEAALIQEEKGLVLQNTSACACVTHEFTCTAQGLLPRRQYGQKKKIFNISEKRFFSFQKKRFWLQKEML
jgi:hypothetical protein